MRRYAVCYICYVRFKLTNWIHLLNTYYFNVSTSDLLCRIINKFFVEI